MRLKLFKYLYWSGGIIALKYHHFKCTFAHRNDPIKHIHKRKLETVDDFEKMVKEMCRITAIS